MDIKEAYEVMQKASGIEAGDTVKILRRARDCEMGWDNGWCDTQNRYVGRTGIVTKVRGGGDGFVVELSGNSDRWTYPFFVLELIEKKKVAPEPGKMKTLRTDDIEVGLRITVLENNRSDDRSWMGSVLEVKAIDLPFIVVSDGGSPFPLRASNYKFGHLSPKYIKAMTK